MAQRLRLKHIIVPVVTVAYFTLTIPNEIATGARTTRKQEIINKTTGNALATEISLGTDCGCNCRKICVEQQFRPVGLIVA